MRLPRNDDWLNEALEHLDNHFELHKRSTELSFSSLSKEEVSFICDEIARCEADAIYYLQNYHVVKTEDQGLRTLTPMWEAQEIFYAKIKSIQDAGRPVKLICLKARQQGASTLSEGLIFHKTIFCEGVTAFIVAQDPDQSAYLFEKSRLALSNLPWWMRPEVLYEVKGKMLTFNRKDAMDRITNPGLNSEIFVEAANKMSGVGIGKTIRAAHFSDISAWPNTPALLTQYLFPSMNASDELAIMESTARGRDHFFFDMWKAAIAGKIDWEPVFIEFFRVKKYSLPIPERVVFRRTEEENEIAARVQADTGVELSDNQLYWRRTKIEETKAIEGSEWGFYGEYPINWMQAFQATGTCAFDKKKLHRMLLTRCCNPLWVGTASLQRDTRNPGKYKEVVNLKPLPRGHEPPSQEEYNTQFYVWELPDPRHGYYVSADPAGGVEGGDNSVCQVMKIGRGKMPDEQVAEWCGRISPTPFAQVIFAIATYYNNAEVAVECNGEVGAMCNNTLFRELSYERIFQWKHYDKVRNYQTDFVGWYTNNETRPKIITRMREAIDADTIILRSAALVDEMMAFSSLGGRYQGQGTHDDRVLAMMIARWCAHDSDWAVQISSTPIDDSRISGFVCSSDAMHNWPSRAMALTAGAGVMPLTARHVHGGVNLYCPICYVENLTSELRFIPRKDYANSEFSPVHDSPNGVRARMVASGFAVQDVWPGELESATPPTDEEQWKLL